MDILRIAVEGDDDGIDDGDVGNGDGKDGDVVVVDNDVDLDDGDITDDGNDDSLGVVDMGTTRCVDDEMSLRMKVVP
jgi:hypothetical protein